MVGLGEPIGCDVDGSALLVSSLVEQPQEFGRPWRKDEPVSRHDPRALSGTRGAIIKREIVVFEQELFSGSGLNPLAGAETRAELKDRGQLIAFAARKIFGAASLAEHAM